MDIQWKNVEKDHYLVAGKLKFPSTIFLFNLFIGWKVNLSDIYPIVVFSVEQNQGSITNADEYFPISLLARYVVEWDFIKWYSTIVLFGTKFAARKKKLAIWDMYKVVFVFVLYISS